MLYRQGRPRAAATGAVAQAPGCLGHPQPGKTTLVQSVLSDKKLTVFDVSAWVNVSKQFSLLKIGSDILKSLNSNINLDSCTSQFLHDSLKKELATRRYLIVLDDLWEEDGDKLESLKRMLQYGCRGSRIIVTTRNLSVVQKLCTAPVRNQFQLGKTARMMADSVPRLRKEAARWGSLEQHPRVAGGGGVVDEQVVVVLGSNGAGWQEIELDRRSSGCAQGMLGSSGAGRQEIELDRRSSGCT